MTTGDGYQTRLRSRRSIAFLPSKEAVIGSAVAYVIGVSIAALIPALGGFADLPVWQLAVRLIGVWIAAVTIDHVVERVIGTLVARSRRNRERRKYTVVDALSGAVLLVLLTIGLSLVFDSGTAFVAGLIIAVLSGVLPPLLYRTE